MGLTEGSILRIFFICGASWHDWDGAGRDPRMFFCDLHRPNFQPCELPSLAAVFWDHLFGIYNVPADCTFLMFSRRVIVAWVIMDHYDLSGPQSGTDEPCRGAALW
jgi:hypothetical protein